MNGHTLGSLIVAGCGIAVVVWLLHKIGKALTAMLEALATLATAFIAAWLLVKFGHWLIKTAVTHWRTTPAVAVVGAWFWWWGWLSLAITFVVVVAVQVVAVAAPCLV